MRITLALLCCPWSYDLLRLDSGVVETVAALNQVFQPLDEPSGWRAVDNIMIEAQRYAEIFPDGYLSVRDAWFFTDAAKGDIECMVVDRDAPTGPFPKHPHCRYTHRPAVFLLHLGIPSKHPPEDWPEASEDHQRHEQNPVKGMRGYPGLLYFLHLGCSDLVMNLSEGLLVRGSNDVGNVLRVSSYITLNLRRHVHLIKQDEVLAAFATRLQGLILINGLCQTDRYERRERQGLARFRLVVP